MRLLLTLLVGVLGGLGAMALHVPAGALVGSMAAVAAVRLADGPVQQFPFQVRRVVQMILGAMLGASFSWDWNALRDVFLPALALTGLLLIITAGMTWVVVHKVCWSWPIALLATAPAGFTELSMAADSMGLDGPTVATIHLVRVCTVVTVVPWILVLFT